MENKTCSQEKTKQRCEICRFWYEHSEKEEIGECRRHSAGDYLWAYDEEHHNFPVAYRTDWCGEWEF